LVKVSGKDKDKAATIKKIEEVSANAMYDCWSMMGQGKLDIFGSATIELGYGSVRSSCVICSRVAVDKSIPDSWLNEPGANINEYLRTKLVPGTKYTYLQTFMGDKSVNSFTSVDDDVLRSAVSDLKNLNAGKESDPNIAVEDRMASGELTVNRELAFVFGQIKSENVGDVLKNQVNLGLTVLGASFMTSPGRAIITSSAKASIASLGGWWSVALVGGAAAGSAGYGAYNAYQGQLTSATYCGPFASQAGVGDKTAELRRGCSVVKGTNYDFKQINNFCQAIEGNP